VAAGSPHSLGQLKDWRACTHDETTTLGVHIVLCRECWSYLRDTGELLFVQHRGQPIPWIARPECEAAPLDHATGLGSRPHRRTTTPPSSEA